jgi:membrane-associated phospholipid phosphatase
MEAFYSWQLKAIANLQDILGYTFSDIFFKFLNEADTLYFYVLLIPFVWWGYKRKWGIRIFYLIILSVVFTDFFKALVHQPRPFNFIPGLGKVFVANYGFPSGAAVNATMLGILLIHYFKRWWVSILAVFYIFIMSLSRVYLGVHFITDIFGGWILGAFLALGFIKGHDKIEAFILKLPIHIAFFLSQLVAVMFFFVLGENHAYEVTAATMAIGTGLYFTERYNLYVIDPKLILERLSRISIVLLGAVIIFFLAHFTLIKHASLSWKVLAGFVSYFLAAFWFSFLANPLIKRVSDLFQK